MNNVMSTILRAASRREDEPLNILSIPYKNEVIKFLCDTGNNIYLLQNENIRWDFKDPTPDNLNLLDFSRGDAQIPLYRDIDLIFCPSRNTPFINWIMQISCFYQIPLMLAEDIPLNPNPNLETLTKVERLKGDANIFQTEFIRGSWVFYNDLNSSVMSYDKKHLERWKILMKHCAKTVYTGQRHYD
jgi:hypothetical protein